GSGRPSSPAETRSSPKGAKSSRNSVSLPALWVAMQRRVPGRRRGMAFICCLRRGRVGYRSRWGKFARKRPPHPALRADLSPKGRGGAAAPAVHPLPLPEGRGRRQVRGPSCCKTSCAQGRLLHHAQFADALFGQGHEAFEFFPAEGGAFGGALNHP